MSRRAVIDTLLADVTLNSLGVHSDSLFQSRGLDERPKNQAPFVLVDWQDQGGNIFDRVKPPRRVMIWVHWPSELSNDYSKIDTVLDRIENVLLDMEHVTGDDGYTITCVRATGRSADLKDEGLHTFCRWAAFEVLSRRDQ
jgi:hypothetical protein